MFDIEYRGGNCVVITTKKSKLISDPKLSVVGLKDSTTEDMIEIATEHRLSLGSPGVRLAIDGPGEYEIGDFSIRGIPALRHIDTGSNELLSTIYTISVSDVKLVILGNISGSLNEEQLEEIGVVDIVILPVGGGGYTLDSVNAVRLVRQIDPKVVVPIHYESQGVQYEVPQDSLEHFIKEIGLPSETVSKYKLKSASALPEVMSVVEIQRT